MLQAVEVMKMAGLALKRNDPGLIWLTLSAVKESMVHCDAGCASTAVQHSGQV